MGKLDKWAIVLLLILIVTSFVFPALRFIFDYESTISHTFVWTALSEMLIKKIVYIGIGVWLYLLNRDKQNGLPYVWLLLGYVFGITAPILFFLLKVYENLKIKEIPASEPQPNVS